MKINTIGHLAKTNPNQTQTKPISKQLHGPQDPSHHNFKKANQAAAYGYESGEILPNSGYLRVTIIRCMHFPLITNQQ